MSVKGGKNYTSFQNVNLKGTGASPIGALRVEGSGFAGTLSVDADYFDQDVAWTLPSKGGGIPISGSFTVQLAAISAFTLTSTAVAVSGIRAEDILTVTPTSTYTYATTRGVPVIVSATPTADVITLQIAEVTGTATIPLSINCAYTAYR